jgi:hypothetical protein
MEVLGVVDTVLIVFFSLKYYACDGGTIVSPASQGGTAGYSKRKVTTVVRSCHPNRRDTCRVPILQVRFGHSMPMLYSREPSW